MFFKQLRKLLQTKASVLVRNLEWQQVLVFLIFCLAVFVRLYNYPDFLYFIYDQGRDAWKLQEIVSGNLTLIGPTSGLEGFFLGPLWYYLGVPGYVLFGGSPYGISVWYIVLSLVALPFYWLISKRLFPKEVLWQVTAFALLSLVVGSVHSSIFIWNPLIAVPLMAAGQWFMFHARTSRLHLFLAFLSLSFVLQSEFAYGIFIVPVFFALIFWIRQRVSLIDYGIAGSAVFLTLLPQLAFEVKNNFLMSRALVSGTVSSTNALPLTEILLKRPEQLLQGTAELLFGSWNGTVLLTMVLLLLAVVALMWIRKKSQFLHDPATHYSWQVTALLAIVPYVGFMAWTGNSGHFFSYYITPHFMFIVPLVLLGVKVAPVYLWAKLLSKARCEKVQVALTTSVVTLLLVTSWYFVADTVISPKNEAGMRVIDSAVSQVMLWEFQDREHVSVFADIEYSTATATFTPNFLTAQYDYFLHRHAQKLNRPVPYTQVRPEDAIVYVIIEPDREIPEKRFAPWYKKVTDGRVLQRRMHLGVLRLESWAQTEFANEYKLPSPYIPTIMEQMCW